MSQKERSRRYYKRHQAKRNAYLRRYRKKHRAQYRQYARTYWKNHARHQLKRAKAYRDEIRQEVLQKYGNRCACCREKTPEFLVLDHVNGHGKHHRLQVGGGGYAMNLWARSHNFPKSLQILCHNCNNAKAYYGQCPHTTLA